MENPDDFREDTVPSTAFTAAAAAEVGLLSSLALFSPPPRL
jgi:hypothetical protein